MSHQALRLWIVLALLVTAVYSAGAQTRAMVSRIDFVGLRHISNDVMRQRIFTRPGDPYNNEVLAHDVIALQNTKYFKSVRFEVKDDHGHANAKIIIFHLVEWRDAPSRPN
jgi:outer membrane protein assembly factor BamA